MQPFLAISRGSWRLTTGLLLILAAWLPCGSGSAADSSGLAKRLRDLSQQYGFSVTGLDLVGNESSGPMRGDPATGLPRLLENYNHVIVRGGKGEVRRLIILSRKQAAPEDSGRILVPTQRRNTHHLVEVRLTGANGETTSAVLTIDTGASFVVLPLSIADSLGFEPEELETKELLTANGKATGRAAVLPSLELGGETVTDVDVVFLENSEPSFMPLLGMSVLGRYRMTLDDANDVLILERD